MQRCPSRRTIEKRILVDDQLVQCTARTDQCVRTVHEGEGHMFESDVRSDAEIVQRWRGVSVWWLIVGSFFGAALT